MDISIKAMHYITAFKLTTRIQSSEGRGGSTDPVANSQLKSLERERKKKKSQNPAINIDNSRFGKKHHIKYFTVFFLKKSQ